MKPDTPSATASIVAKNIALVARTARLKHLVPREAARLTAQFIAATTPDGAKFLRRAENRFFQVLCGWREWASVPGLALHQALRKLRIEDAARAGLMEGLTQLVVLGAGLDTLALRLSREFPAANFLELDHPATQRLKRETTQGLSETNLAFAPVDFTRRTLDECLATCAEYEPERPTTFVCEGVSMYLSGSEINDLFDALRRQPSPRKRFIFTFLELQSNGRPEFRRMTPLARRWLEWRNETFKWGVAREDIESFLRARGFHLRELATSETLRQLYLAQPDLKDEVLAEGENVCVCDALDGERENHLDVRLS